MGQYYKTVIENADGWRVLHPHKHNNGLKLMEHSYVGNEYVNAVVTEMMTRGICRVAHMGDYSDYPDVKTKSMKRKMQFYSKAWGKNCDKYDVGTVKFRLTGDDVYIVNHDRKEYVRFMWSHPRADMWINAFMLLIAVGNGLGGGDYSGKNEGLVGRWAFDRLEVCENEPDDCLKIHGWEFKED